ncbi:MAG: hypothetical protein H0X17_10285 [Deltaproteobacteria bacterium]|nr:hypothetical protein [Deltaproteobacteria bacterium]
MVRSCAVVVLAAGALFAGCKDGGPAGPDAGCWPMEAATPGGEVELGTGIGGFEPLPASLRFIQGTQGGTFLVVNARIRGLAPGNPNDFFDPGNPKTLFTAIEFDGTEIRPPCPGTLGYVPAGPDHFERARAQYLEFLPYEVGSRAFNTNVRLVVEIIDANGRYARDERVVFAEAPPSSIADAGAEAAATD